MIPADIDYVRPASLGEALSLLNGAAAMALAGGQSLVPMLTTRSVKPSLLVDVSRLVELRQIEASADSLAIGAAVTLSAVAESAAARAVPLLADVLRSVGSTAIRNRGTFVGNLVSASPNSELPVAVVALEASLVIQSVDQPSGASVNQPGGASEENPSGASVNQPSGASEENPGGASIAKIRTISAADFFVGAHRTALERGELVTAIRFLLTRGPTTRAGFAEVAARAGAPPLCCVAACLELDDGGLITAARIVAGGIGERPERCGAAEAAIVGHAATEALARLAVVVTRLAPSPDLPDAAYASDVCPVLIARAVTCALSTPLKPEATAERPA